MPKEVGADPARRRGPFVSPRSSAATSERCVAAGIWNSEKRAPSAPEVLLGQMAEINEARHLAARPQARITLTFQP